MEKAHIISHTHWDREWYLPYEKHHMLLVEFMDTLIDTLEKDSEYKSFHLDGQTIILDDYLQVRPEKKSQLKRLIEDGRIHVGPWYVLQDEFLTSSEANVRNLLIGHRDAKEYGPVCKIGYFPDSFGNMGQAPQILQQAGIDTAVFGRGVKPTGFNNQVGESESFESPYSEMYWESKDGSKVLSVLFANWYSNGNEVPVDVKDAKAFWEQKLVDARKYASTEHMLFMNGCDHQPVQTDLSIAIKRAQELYPDVEFIHSNFPEYIQSIKKELKEDMAVIQGELRSQKTDGWYTLANTASARVYIKQMNTRCQMLFEKMAEPIATIAHKAGMPYPHHLFVYGWKTLMQNHPHDSICGCSVDSVHREMVTRFEKAENVALHIIEESLAYLSSHINTSEFANIHEEARPFFIVNTTGWNRHGVVELELEVEKKYFREGPLKEVIQKIKDVQIPILKVVDKEGNTLPAKVEEIPIQFNYDLPKDKFRQPYLAKRVKVTLEVDSIPSFGWETFALVPVDDKIEQKGSLFTGQNTVENKYLIATVKENGSLTVKHKESGQVFSNLCIYEDHGDIGNEYIYMMPVGEKTITTKDCKAEISVLEDSPYQAVIQVKNTIHIPKKANEVLDQEIQDLVEFKHRKAQRVNESISMEILTTYIIERKGRGIKVKTSFVNEALDHRLRVLFETNIATPYHYADSIFEVAQRDNTPSKEWENPCNAQHQQAFINIHNDRHGLTIANKGLNEYEVLRDGKNTIAVTLHRGVRELGDWGVFLTPEAQCLGSHEVEFEIIPHGHKEDMYHSYIEAYQYQVDWVMNGLEIQQGEMNCSYGFMETKGLEVVHSSLKISEDTGDVLGRWYNLSDKEKEVTINTKMRMYQTNLLEGKTDKQINNQVTLNAAEILTIGFED